MGNKTRTALSGSHDDRVMRELQHMRHKDLQEACLKRGLDVEAMVDMSHHQLVSWFYKNYDNGVDESRLEIANAWMEQQLIARGAKKGEALLHPDLRFGAVGDIEAMEKPNSQKAEKAVTKKGKKPKAEVDDKTGVRKGTKKAMTFDLALKGTPLDEIIKQVKETFPDAEPKSIKIWYKKALKGKAE